MEQFDADFNAGSRVNFKLTKDNGSIYLSALDLDGVNLLDSKYTLNLSPNEDARVEYDLKVTLRQFGGPFDGKVGLLRLPKGSTAENTLTEKPAQDFYEPNTDYTGFSDDGKSYTAGFRKTWSYRG